MKAKIVASLLIASLAGMGVVWMATNTAFLPADQVKGVEKAATIFLVFFSAVGITALVYLILVWLWRK